MAGHGRWGQSGTIPVAVQRAVRRRDGDECQLRYPGCTGVHEQFDHKVNLASRGIDRRNDKPKVADLQCVCVPCHKVKTQREAMVGRGLAPKPIEPDHRLGRVALPAAFRYRPD